MELKVEAACGCHIGKIRKNNEDNFYFDGQFLEQDHLGLENTASFETRAKNGMCIAVFDGMGGENFGEAASFSAARHLQQTVTTPKGRFVWARKHLENMAFGMNHAVTEAKHALCTDRMGTTMVMLYFTPRHVYACNVGDSRAYRLRNGNIQQLSKDHVERHPTRKKTPLTQHLGIDPEDMIIEPHIVKSELRKGDQYLLCSDGLTDMLTDFEIFELMQKSDNTKVCVDTLIHAALDRGGRDNITVIACSITSK